AITSSQVVECEGRPARPSTSAPPANSIISGNQCPAQNGGAIHPAKNHSRCGKPRTDAAAASIVCHISATLCSPRSLAPGRGATEHVCTPRQLDHLRQPMPGTERRVDPLGKEHQTMRQASHRRCSRFDRLPHLCDDLLAAIARSEPGGERSDRICDTTKRARI